MTNTRTECCIHCSGATSSLGPVSTICRWGGDCPCHKETCAEWERIVRGVLQNEMVEAQFIDKLVDFLKETVEKAHMKGYTEGRIVYLEQHKGQYRDTTRELMNEAERRGAERAIDYVLKHAGEVIENEEGAQIGVKVDILTLEAAKKVTD